MKKILQLHCLAALLLTKLCSGVPCNGENYPKLKRQCAEVLQEKIRAMRGDLTRNCRDFAEFAVCLRDGWRIAYCDNATALARNNDTLLADMERKYFPKCFNDTSADTKECRPDKSLRKFLSCASRFYDSSVHISDKRSSISLGSLCPEVDKYGLCVHRIQQEANCSLGHQIVPHIKFIANSISHRYRLLCTALRKAAFQKGNTICNRQRFINDMFLCGYHFANIAEVLGNDKPLCPYLEKYRTCQNKSIEVYGCAPPDQLYKDAEKFFELLTKKYVGSCASSSQARSILRTSRLTLREGAAYTCDGNRFIRYFFQCASGFVNSTGHLTNDAHYICRAVSIYRHCVNGARHATHCNTRMELNTHLAYMQNYILEQYEPMCAMRRGKTPEQGDSESEKTEH